jgi:flavin-dependent dehydrogenase
VRWLPCTRFVSFDGQTLIVTRRNRREAHGARFIVGADGPRSTVARALGLDRNSDFLVGLEEVVSTPQTSAALHCFLDPKLAPGYIAWIAADGNTSHLGVGGYRQYFDPSQALMKFRQRVRHIVDGHAIERRGGLIPVNGVLRRIANERGLLVGDAAGAVSPLTAGGLDGAMRLSELAAEVIAAYLDRGDPEILRQYDGARFQPRFLARRWMRRLWRMASSPLLAEIAFAALAVPPLDTFARHIFFSRGSFPDIPRAKVPVTVVT